MEHVPDEWTPNESDDDKRGWLADARKRLADMEYEACEYAGDTDVEAVRTVLCAAISQCEAGINPAAYARQQARLAADNEARRQAWAADATPF